MNLRITVAGILIALSFYVRASAAHPSLFVDGKEFKQLHKALKATDNKALTAMHETYMAWADEFVRTDSEITFSPNSSGKLLLVSRDALSQIASCAYAYRFTEKKEYLRRAESVLNAVCSFPTWNPAHYLDVAEMSLAVAIGYDWLYHGLGKETLEKCEKAIKTHCLDVADGEYRRLFRLTNNWGQVLNAGLLCSCIAFADVYPERCQELMRRCIADNSENFPVGYAPDGIYVEGPMYWDYGTTFQIAMIAALESYCGTDMGLSKAPGFIESAWFEVFSTGNLSLPYNFSDSSLSTRALPMLWYFTHKTSDGSLVHSEYDRRLRLRERLGFLAIWYASKCDRSAIRPPERNIFYGKGTNPLVIARTGWGQDDHYLGVKGGGAVNGHAHLDAGSFVYEAYGVRWACEPPFPGYSRTEGALGTIGATPWLKTQDSYRWKIKGYNNLHHNTLTIGGKDFDCTGIATLEKVYDSPDNMGGLFDLTSMYGDRVRAVMRQVSVIDGSYLKIVDVVSASDNTDAEVYFNFTTREKVQLLEDCLVLTSSKGVKMRLDVSGDDVVFTQGIVRPEGVPDCLEKFYAPDGYNYVGYRYVVPKGSEKKIVTTLKRM